MAFYRFEQRWREGGRAEEEEGEVTGRGGVVMEGGIIEMDREGGRGETQRGQIYKGVGDGCMDGWMGQKQAEEGRRR